MFRRSCTYKVVHALKWRICLSDALKFDATSQVIFISDRFNWLENGWHMSIVVPIVIRMLVVREEGVNAFKTWISHLFKLLWCFIQVSKSKVKCYFHFVISLLYPICNYNVLCNPLKYILIITHPVSVDKISIFLMVYGSGYGV